MAFLAVRLSAPKQVPVFTEFQPFQQAHLENLHPDTTYIYNFWATWCRPCIAELPYFEKFNEKHKDEPYKMVLVSLDFEDKVETAVKPFMERKNIKSDVVVLADGKASEWIDKIDSSWSGAIPATLVAKGDRRLFFEKSYETYDALTSDLLKIDKNE